LGVRQVKLLLDNALVVLGVKGGVEVIPKPFPAAIKKQEPESQVCTACKRFGY